MSMDDMMTGCNIDTNGEEVDNSIKPLPSRYLVAIKHKSMVDAIKLGKHDVLLERVAYHLDLNDLTSGECSPLDLLRHVIIDCYKDMEIESAENRVKRLKGDPQCNL